MELHERGKIQLMSLLGEKVRKVRASEWGQTNLPGAVIEN
jgi:hypothetical protein